MLRSGEIREDEQVDFVVPTGNFGNILAGWYAKQMGLPIGRLICASNSNKILSDFLNTGKYDKNREFTLTISPSMDILISSNLERLLYEYCGRDGETVQWLYEGLDKTGRIYFTRPEGFLADYATEGETLDAIKAAHKQGYTMDTHTAVAYAVYNKVKPKNKAVIVSTASPYKFGADVLRAIDGGDYAQTPVDEIFERLSGQSGVAIPEAIKDITQKPIKHTMTCKTDEMSETVEKILGVG
jgi:threonine synthase